ncbi:uncharacterized protein EI97DRAFT_486286 [Westerdykella ornata]|uniref:F-box domain-containing protein n=1 Tax=Westerdykella ornata TaxID=318751 RepID=A0A6A6JPQ6_WESOR|nr:uncharacterized protein EI97DRAFT_486286 [Westerdykella ornata]KAF2278235.1 hypothetical protein EI97DRAFT_486286 [Westerdykella ornata]
MSQENPDPPGDPSTFPFMRLPKDVRLMVYERLPRRITKVVVRPWGDNDSELHLYLRGTDAAILRASRRIYEEAKPFVRRIAKEFILCKTPQIAYQVGSNSLIIPIGDLIMGEIDKSVDTLKENMETSWEMSQFEAYLATLKMSSKTINARWDKISYNLPLDLAKSLSRYNDHFHGRYNKESALWCNAAILKQARFIRAFIIQSPHQLLYRHIMCEKGMAIGTPPLTIDVLYDVTWSTDTYETLTRPGLRVEALLDLRPVSLLWKTQRGNRDVLRCLIGVKRTTLETRAQCLEPPQSFEIDDRCLRPLELQLQASFPTMAQIVIHGGMSRDTWRENWIPSHVINPRTQLKEEFKIHG